MIRFKVEGTPQGKARPRVYNGHAYTPTKTVHYEHWIAICLDAKMHEEGRTRSEFAYLSGEALQMKVVAYFPIPRSYSKKKIEAIERKELLPTKKPDIDNIAKIVCDALNGIAYHDDSQIVDIRIHKRYTREPEGFLDIMIEEVGE